MRSLLLGLSLSIAASVAQAQTPDGTPDIKGTGPYPAAIEKAPGLQTHVIYHPANLDALGGRKLGILAWGNGGCQKHSSPFPYLGQIASHGYLVVTPGEIKYGPPPARGGEPRAGRPPVAAAAPAAGAPRAGGFPLSPTSAKDVLAGIDWAVAENSRKGSPFEGRIDVTKIAVSGHSCGGLQALQVGADPRVKAVIGNNTGTFPPSANVMGEPGDGAVVLPRLHTPVLYVLGGTTDVAYVNGMADFDRIRRVPVYVLDADVGHGNTFSDPNGGDAASIAINWLDWQLNGNKEAARNFVGANCVLCSSAKWKIRQKGF
jgi:hypothetical protein